MGNERAERRRRRRHRRKETSTKKKVLIALAIVFAAMIILPIGAFAVAYSAATVPTPGQLVTKQVSNIYASDGTTEIARIVPPEGNREQVTIDQIPQSLRDAVLAAEDREFYTNRGFSVTGFARAIKGQITGDDSAGGGSTITQQYVKNAVVGNDRSYKRKIKELVYSAKMANEWSKDEVLQAYLNTIYFGRNSYGVAAAAQAYFGKPLADLTFEESAVLAASIQRPSSLDPWTNREEAEARWNYVLDGMVQIGAITPEQRAAAVYPEVIDPANNRAFTQAEGTNGLIKNRVIAELAEHGISEEDVETRGLKVTTTINPVDQEAAVNAVHSNLEPLKPETRAAVVSIEPKTGAVRAYYGGDDPNGWDYANAGLQTGSTFKIFGLAAALQQGIPLSQAYSSAPVTTGDVTVNNVEGNDCGFCSIQEALKRSHNTSFIRLQNDLRHGPQDVADMAHALGVARSLPGIDQTLTENGAEPYQGIILGQYQSRPFDMAIALATLSDEGVWHQPYFVQKVEDAKGEVLYEHKESEGERRVSANVANNVVAAMGPIAAYSNGNALAGGRISAAKTGTVQLGDTGQNKDAWMIGSTPQLATAVWVGTEDNSALLNSWGGLMYGSNTPARIWKATMDGALADQPYEEFPTPKGLGFSTVPYVYQPPAAPTYNSPAPTDEQQPAEEAPVEEAPAPVAPEAPPADVEIAPGLVIPGDLIPPALQAPAEPAPAE
ncbi:transglycosylase domain-containing protein [Corynebacterium aquilae]|uniref:transglycosylase domain-containing protein n=1 Tax=Corynebacterium aquilae TaxID=203263 RepID=UPI003CCBFDA9